MSPEQATADPHTDHRADIYALGIMAYEMLTGMTPFGGRAPQATLAAHVMETPENISRLRPTIPPLLAAIIMRCIEKRAADRPQSAHELVDQLDSLTTPSGGMIPTAAVPVTKRRARGLLPVSAALVVVAAGISAYTVYARTRNNAAAEPSTVRSIAVLPFTNMSGDPSNEYFSDGLAEDLLNVLAQMPNLRVAARTSAFEFKGKNTDIREVGAKLGVVTVLEGSVRKSGDRMRITAQLINTKTGYHMWSRTFDRQVVDVFAVQDEITQAIGEALKVEFGSAPSTGSRNRSVNLEAYDLYLKGNFASNHYTIEDLKKALEYYRKAVALDSTFANAYVNIASTRYSQISAGFASIADAMPEMKAAIDKAARLSPSEPRVLALRSQLLQASGDVQGAEELLRRITRDAPNFAPGHGTYGVLLGKLGRGKEALDELRAAVTLDPLSFDERLNYAAQLLNNRDYEGALREFREASRIRPGNPASELGVAVSLAEAGHLIEAQQVGERTVKLAAGDPYQAIMLAYIYGKAGRRKEAIEVLRRMEKTPAVSEYGAEMAAAYGRLGDKETAFKWLDRVKSIEGLSPALDPMFDSLRDDPRFNAFLAKWNLKPQPLPVPAQH
jgi:serine/threonine-protein kinase